MPENNIRLVLTPRELNLINESIDCRIRSKRDLMAATRGLEDHLNKEILELQKLQDTILIQQR